MCVKVDPSDDGARLVALMADRCDVDLERMAQDALKEMQAAAGPVEVLGRLYGDVLRAATVVLGTITESAVRLAMCGEQVAVYLGTADRQMRSVARGSSERSPRGVTSSLERRGAMAVTLGPFDPELALRLPARSGSDDLTGRLVRELADTTTGHAVIVGRVVARDGRHSAPDAEFEFADAD